MNLDKIVKYEVVTDNIDFRVRIMVEVLGIKMSHVLNRNLVEDLKHSPIYSDIDTIRIIKKKAYETANLFLESERGIQLLRQRKLERIFNI